MGESDRYTEYRRSRSPRMTLGQEGNALVALFSMHVIFFLLLLSIKVIYGFVHSPMAAYQRDVVGYFQLPGNLTLLSERPWTLLTYSFSDTNLWGFITHMIWLWAFGYILQHMTGNRKLIPIYLYAATAGAIGFIAATYAVPSTRILSEQQWFTGASAGIMGIAIATTTLVPGYRFFRNINGGIPLWVLTVIYVIMNLVSLSVAPPSFGIAMAFGGFTGFLFIMFLRKGHDGSNWMNNLYDWFMNLFNPNKKGKADLQPKVYYQTGGREPFHKRSNVTQQRIDEILDKINQKGYHFLTDEEKNILKRAAEEDL